MRILVIVALAYGVVGCPSLGAKAAESTPTTSAKVWVRGEVAGVPLPVWGVADGLQIGLSPLPGPRGLLRVYAPYLKQPVGHVINFIAVEPITKGVEGRGLSELEFSQLDNKPGKRFWDSNTSNPDAPTGIPVAGILETVDGNECLSVYVLVERFDNGAHVYLRLTFDAERPHEVRIATYAQKDSAPLDYCIVTATMGNYARLRRLQLADKVAVAGELWPEYRGEGFADHAKFPLATLKRNAAGHAWAVAETDETDLTIANYAPETRLHWKYQGDQATQSWKSEQPDPGLEVWVNGRYTYWASRSPIPGGIAFENFEMVTPFRQGEEFIFRVEPKQETQ